MKRELRLGSIVLRPRDIALERLVDPYRWHQWMLARFAPSEPQTLLWHVENWSAGLVRVLVLTDGEVAPGVRLPPETAFKPYRLDAIATGRRFHFAVTCAPRRQTSFPVRRKVRISDDDLPDWFAAHAPHWGLRPLALALVGSGSVGFTGKNHRWMEIFEASFEGTLEVTDAEAFIRALTSGIGGRARFGYGLLRLARL